ncbi:1,3-beta-glucanosyltransferase gel1 [Lachnellula suecica]|uniref:1,3-beta-glucanosyltransferase n=1 Tax=Lachnellula suecica TaxID=602035 RepID=A0A8T9CHJ6_9HELO|nr:1,3-beta-glucanosyltransferase gel1 [Lachnellula suecica]
MKLLPFFAALAVVQGQDLPSRTIANLPRATSSGSLPVVSVKGNAFFADGKRFYVRGVAYQPGGAANAADPLIDIPSLTRDVANFKKLGINAIRVYTVDNSVSHDEGMKLLADAGIYLALDANTPSFSLNRQSNATLFQSYNENYLQSIFATIDNFASYSNLLLMINGNEVINERNNTIAAPYVKALNRDMKAYTKARGYRAIPFGYAAADVAENVDQQLAYFDCGPDEVRGDFFALNDYSWCDPSSFTVAGWDKKVKRYSGYGVPLFMAEFGCNTNTREWGEIAALYSTNMTSVYSGGLAYEYTAEANGYGLVSLSDGEVTPNSDFDRLQEAYEATPNPTGDGGYSETTTASECPAESDDWAVANSLLPAMPSKAQDYFDDGAGTGPGLDDDTTPSQYGGDSYSEGLVAMDGSQASVTNSGTSTKSGSSASSTASGNGGVLNIATSSVFGLPIVVSLMGLLAGMGMMV